MRLVKPEWSMPTRARPDSATSKHWTGQDQNPAGGVLPQDDFRLGGDGNKRISAIGSLRLQRIMVSPFLRLGQVPGEMRLRFVNIQAYHGHILD